LAIVITEESQLFVLLDSRPRLTISCIFAAVSQFEFLPDIKQYLVFKNEPLWAPRQCL